MKASARAAEPSRRIRRCCLRIARRPNLLRCGGGASVAAPPITDNCGLSPVHGPRSQRQDRCRHRRKQGNRPGLRACVRRRRLARRPRVAQCRESRRCALEVPRRAARAACDRRRSRPGRSGGANGRSGRVRYRRDRRPRQFGRRRAPLRHRRIPMPARGTRRWTPSTSATSIRSTRC